VLLEEVLAEEARREAVLGVGSPVVLVVVLVIVVLLLLLLWVTALARSSAWSSAIMSSKSCSV
jgi:hypothetical protein